MRIAIHSHSATATSGGGVLYVYALSAALAAEHDVELIYPPTVEADVLERMLPTFEHHPRLRHQQPTKGPALLREVSKGLRDLRYDASIVQSAYVPRFAFSRRSFLLCEFPLSKRLTAGERLRLRSFRTIVANSHYTAGWIKHRWGRTAKVLHPPVRAIEPRPKQPIILALGRFTAGGRSKRQLDLVALFRRLLEAGVEGWELHLAGFPHDADYVTRVEQAAHGMPVRIHIAPDRDELERLIGRASLFWHATGAGVDAEAEPEKMEHFGIATVEAMSAGTVPVVIGRGGQPEILGDPPCGVLWQTEDEALEATRRLIHDSAKREALAAQAIERARTFGFGPFAQRARRLIEDRS